VPLLYAYGLFRFLEASSSSSPTVLTTTGPIQPNPTYFSWYKQDHMLLGWLRSSLTREVLAQVVSANTFTDLWLTLSAILIYTLFGVHLETPIYSRRACVHWWTCLRWGFTDVYTLRIRIRIWSFCGSYPDFGFSFSCQSYLSFVQLWVSSSLSNSSTSVLSSLYLIPDGDVQC
jgi:hypothetical protein